MRTAPNQESPGDKGKGKIANFAYGWHHKTYPPITSMAEDTYKTITGKAESVFTEKRSRFLSFAHHVESAEEVRDIVKEYEKTYYDARHVCYSYMVGPDRKEFRANDNGEPSGTAGRPILGQINSLELTNVLVVVVRYFGGIKLGTPGLIAAYKQAARDVLEKADIQERTIDVDLTVTFEYPFLSEVLRVLRSSGAEVRSQDWNGDCIVAFRARKSVIPTLTERLEKIQTLRFPSE